MLRLDDSSLWEVDEIDVIKSMLWLPASEVIVCGGKIINDDDVVGAAPLSGTTALIQAALNSEAFVINGALFKAKTFCFGIQPGDRVVFISGSALGACASAEFIVVNSGRSCRVWCE